MSASQAPPSDPQSPGVRVESKLCFLALDTGAQACVALGAGDHSAGVQHELATDEALEARASEQRLQLLFERPMEGSNRGHSERNTPVTRPRICTCAA